MHPYSHWSSVIAGTSWNESQEHVELSEGASFRISVDADWLETDMISIEFRLLCRPLPDHDPIASPHRRRSSVSEEETSQECMKEVL